MKFLARRSLYGRNYHRIQLETDEERALTDTQLIIACDNYGDWKATDRSFGGYVRRDGDLCDVNVYID